MSCGPSGIARLSPAGEYWDALSYDWDGTPVHNQDAHRQRTVNWINAAGGLSTAFDITLKGIMHAGEDTGSKCCELAGRRVAGGRAYLLCGLPLWCMELAWK